MNAASSSSDRNPSAAANLWLWGGLAGVCLVGALAWWFVSSRPENLATGYGRRRGQDYAASVNGTAVLASLFTSAGHKVTSTFQLTPRLDKARVIVWAPDDFAPPDQKVRDHLRDWFKWHQGQKLIYIGRDYDAAIAYWQDVRSQASPERIDRVERELAFSQSRHHQASSKTDDKNDIGWFVTQVGLPPKHVTELAGPWADGLDATQTNIDLDVRLAVPAANATTPPATNAPQHEVLLSGNGEPLITRVSSPDWGAGEVIVVQNGSFLLNYPLLRHEHRKIAGKLVEHCGPPTEVVFLESTANPTIVDREEMPDLNPFRILTVWPINVILLHATIVGILFCLAWSPIFGRPRLIPTLGASDFGKHVLALGQLLARTKDSTYASQRIAHYRTQAQRSSGKAHRGKGT